MAEKGEEVSPTETEELYLAMRKAALPPEDDGDKPKVTAPWSYTHDIAECNCYGCAFTRNRWQLHHQCMQALVDELEREDKDETRISGIAAILAKQTPFVNYLGAVLHVQSVWRGCVAREKFLKRSDEH